MIKKILLKLSGGVDLGYNKPGLGPNCLAWARLLFPFQRLFYYAAYRHDILGYAKGGNEQDRLAADLMLFYDMLSVSHGWLQNEFAYLYFKLVRIFGRFFFNYNLTYTV